MVLVLVNTAIAPTIPHHITHAHKLEALGQAVQIAAIKPLVEYVTVLLAHHMDVLHLVEAIQLDAPQWEITLVMHANALLFIHQQFHQHALMALLIIASVQPLEAMKAKGVLQAVLQQLQQLGMIVTHRYLQELHVDLIHLLIMLVLLEQGARHVRVVQEVILIK